MFRPPSSSSINFTSHGVHTSLISSVWGHFDVFSGRCPSDFYHSLVYLTTTPFVVPWSHASEGCYNLLAPTMCYLMFIGHFYVVCSLNGQFYAPLFYYWADRCMMYPANLSHWLDCFYLLIMTLDLFGSRFYVLERSIYWDALSFVERTFGSWALVIIKYFCKTIGSFVEYLVWRLESLILSSVLVDLCISNTFCRMSSTWWRKQFG